MTGDAIDPIAVLTAILYGARYQRRLPETEGQRRQAVAEAIEDAKLIMMVVTEDVPPAEPEQPPPSPGTIGRIADAKATRRRG